MKPKEVPVDSAIPEKNKPMHKRTILALLLFFTLYASSCKTLHRATPKEASAPAIAVSEENRRKIDYLYMEGVRLKNAGKDDAALEMFKRCYEIDTLHAPSMYELSNYYLGMNMAETARRLLQKAVQIAPDNKWYKWRLADALLSMGDLDAAIPLLEKMIAEDNNTNLMEVLVSLYAQSEQYENAIATLDRLEKEIGSNEFITMGKYRFYMTMDKEKEAFKEIDLLIKEDPTNLHLQILKGDLLLANGNREAAEQIYRQVAEQDPEHPELTVALAQLHAVNNIPQMEDLKRVIHHDEISIVHKNLFLQRYLFSLNAKSDPQQYNTCDSLFTYLIEKYPLDLSVKQLYSDFLNQQDKKQEAMAQIESIVEIDPNNEKGWGLLVNYYVKHKDFAKLAHIAENAIKAFPQKALFWFYLGASYAQDENKEELALQTLEKGIATCPNDGENVFILSEMYGLLGDLYQKKKEEEKTIAAYEQALKYNDKNTGVLNNYSYYLSQQRKDLKKAEWMSGKCIELEPDNPTFLDTYAWIYFMQGNYTLALFYIERAFDKQIEENGEVIEHYGDILYMNGEKEKAVEQWKKALEMEQHSDLLKEKIKTQTYIQ